MNRFFSTIISNRFFLSSVTVFMLASAFTVVFAVFSVEIMAQPYAQNSTAEGTKNEGTVSAPQEMITGGAGDLLVAPTRVVFEGRSRSAEIILNNKGSKEATYRISFTHLRLEADGNYTELSPEEAKAGLKIADDLLRYSPRQVTLKPGESQIIKMMLRKPEGLANGEYVSHLLFRAVPDMATGEDVEAAGTSGDKISVKLIPVYGVSIPIIVRNGETSASAKLQDITLYENTLSLNIIRSGNKSLYGDIIITSGTNEVLGQLRGVGVFAYNDRRQVSIPVSKSEKPLKIVYREREEDGGAVIDRAEIAQ